jgi:hypothetical protein
MTRLVTTTAAIAFCLIAHTSQASAQGSANTAANPAPAASTACKTRVAPPPRRPQPPPGPPQAAPSATATATCAPVVNVNLAPGTYSRDCDPRPHPCRDAPPGVKAPAEPPVAESPIDKTKHIERAIERESQFEISIGNAVKASFKSKDQIFIFTCLATVAVFVAVYGWMHFRRSAAVRTADRTMPMGAMLGALVLALAVGALVWFAWPAPTVEQTSGEVVRITKQQLAPDPLAAPPAAIVLRQPEAIVRSAAAVETPIQQTSFVVLAALFGLVAGLALMPVALLGVMTRRDGSARRMDDASAPFMGPTASAAVVAAVYEVEDALRPLQRALADAPDNKEKKLPIGPLVRALEGLSWALETAGDTMRSGARNEREGRFATLSAPADARREVLGVVHAVQSLLEDRHDSHPAVWADRATRRVWRLRQQLIDLAEPPAPGE